jgi:hypothetical protein
MPRNLITPEVFIKAVKERFATDDYKIPKNIGKNFHSPFSYRIKKFMQKELEDYDIELFHDYIDNITFPDAKTISRAFVTENSISKKLLDICGYYVFGEDWSVQRPMILEECKKATPFIKTKEESESLNSDAKQKVNWLSEDSIIIKITEYEKTDFDKFIVFVQFGDKKPIQCDINNPVNFKNEEELEWYFETYISEPYTAKTKVKRSQDYIEEYGKNLFNTVFKDNSSIYETYKTIKRNHKLSKITIEITGDDKDFQGIHWESMYDDTFGEPLTIKGVVFVRKLQKTPVVEAKVASSPLINLLIVTARPNEENDVNHRTIQRPLIDLIQKSHFRIRPHILRPGTFEAFMKHLDYVSEGYYHIIHFDLHGKVASWEELTEAKEANKLTFQQYTFQNTTSNLFNERYGFKDLEKFDGKKAFVFFESDEPGVAIPIAANELATTLQSRHIPVCILNACQSAKQDKEFKDNETTIGQALIQQSMHIVLAMRYSISVTSAKQLMEKLYGSLLSDNYSLEKAVLSGRQSLYRKKNRTASLGQEIDLEDWMLPIVYKNQDFKFQLREFESDEETLYNLKDEKHSLYVPPKYGFVGRDLDILKIEKLLLQKNHLLLIGMLGNGKSALLKYLSWWWQVTYFVEDVFYFDFANKHFNLENIIHSIAQSILSKGKYKDNFKDKKFTNQKADVISLLKETSYCVIIDNILEYKDLEVIQFLKRIIGKSYVVYGSVNPENVIDSLVQFNKYRLNGLDEDAVYELAKVILKKECNKKIKDIFKEEQFDFQHLLKILMGFPSMLELVLPKLKGLKVTEVLERFQSGTLELNLR